MKPSTPIFMLLITFSLSAVAERLTPTPEAGLWRSESRVISNNQVSLVSPRDARQLAELPPNTYRRLLNTAMTEAVPEVVLECVPAHLASELGHLYNLQNIIQRKVPECDLNLQKLNRSALKVSGNCYAQQGLNGALHGMVEFVSSQEIHVSLLGNDPSVGQNQSTTIPNLANTQHYEVHRWTSHDCGQVQPRERFSF